MSRTIARRDRRGVALVIMAVMIIMTLGMAALAIDYGMIKSSQTEAQRAVDASALAGASAFQISDPAVDKNALAITRAKEFARKHTVHNVLITDPEVDVHPDATVDTVGVVWARSGLRLWFANIFGSSTMGITAHATAQASESGNANCLKPVALPDMWNNVNNVTSANSGPGTQLEDKNGNHVWDAPDLNGNGIVDPGEFEPWTFNTGDVYDPPTTGYGTTFRDGYTAPVKDYGRQVLLQTFDQSPSGDRLVSSYFRTWQDNANTGGVDSLAAGIRGERCIEASVGTPYTQANGAKEPLQLAWEYIINQDASAHWQDTPTATVVGSTFGTNWLTQSPRVVVVGLYPPAMANSPSSNPIQFTNFAKIWIDQRPCSATSGGLGTCKNPITARFLGYVEGGTGGPTTGSLIKRLVLIK
ncbi:MAG TPA: Tad domain-containing protein [Gemmatimonadales bacterium]|jgi:Flp pilus assembly protein TadG|nr:Tad domain-containing protein [Gemmatimonadales bacterium]